MLKIIWSSHNTILYRNKGNRSASIRNDDNKPAFGKKDGNNEFDRFSGYGVQHVKKSRKSKSEKLAKSQKLSKSKGKKLEKLSKSRNSLNFDATETGPSFWTPGTRKIFNRLQLAFVKALIVHHFDPGCHIWIENDALGFDISNILN